MTTSALLLELLLSGFFAVACFRARANDSVEVALTPRNFLRLTDRVERLRRTRWQWFAMVLVVVVVRLQSGHPLMAELTVAAQFLLFLVLPTAKQTKTVGKLGRVKGSSLRRMKPAHGTGGKA